VHLICVHVRLVAQVASLCSSLGVDGSRVAVEVTGLESPAPTAPAAPASSRPSSKPGMAAGGAAATSGPAAIRLPVASGKLKCGESRGGVRLRVRCDAADTALALRQVPVVLVPPHT